MKHLLALRHRRRIVDVDDGVLHAVERLERLLDDMFARLRQDLHGHVVGNQVVLHEAAQERELRIGCGREAHLDLLEADLHEHLVEFQLLLQAHRYDQRLVAVAQIDAAPRRRLRRMLLLEPAQIYLRRQKILLLVLCEILHK